MKELRNYFIKKSVSEAVARGVSHNENLTDAVLKSRQMRLEIERGKQGASLPVNLVKFGLEWVHIPISTGIAVLSPYGIYDGISIVEGVVGKEFGGGKLDWIDRAIFIGSGVAPWMPAVVLRGLARGIRHGIEDRTFSLTRRED